MAYFSQREYGSFLAASVSHIAVAWFALAGRPLTKQQRSRLEVASASEGEVTLPEAAPRLSGPLCGRTFAEWVQIGLAITLPLIVFGVIALITFMWLAAKT